MQTNSILGNFSREDFLKNAVIEPPTDYTFFDTNLKKTRIIVDSRVRNTNLFPNQNSYDIQFDDDIDDVIQVTLLYCDIPMPMYLINNYFNKLIVSIAGTDYTVILTNGDYDNTTLATELQTKINAATGYTFIVAYVALTDNFSFTINSTFTLKFIGYTNSLNQLLGFNFKNYIAISNGLGGYVITSEFKINFNYNNYLIMDIEQFDTLKSTDRDLNKSFAIIPKNFNNLNICDEFSYIKRFSPPIGKLARIKVRFYDRFGNLYDFQNMDHRYELLFESHKQKRKYGNMFGNNK